MTPESEAPAFANRTLESNPPPLPRSQSPKLRDLPAPQRAKAQPPPIPPPLPRAALTISLERSQRPAVKAPSELVFPPDFEADSCDSDAPTPEVDIPTLSPDRPNLHIRPPEMRADEPTETIAPIPAPPSRTNLIIAVLCAVGVLGAAGVVLYSAFTRGEKRDHRDATSAASNTPVEQTATLEAEPVVTPIVEPIASEPEVAPAVEPTPAVAKKTATASAKPARRDVSTARDDGADEPSEQTAAEPTRSRTERAAHDEPTPAVATSPTGAKKTAKAAAPAGAVAEKSAPEKSAPAAAQAGVLMLGSKPPCAIHIDGRDTGLTTPQRSIELTAGSHKVSLVNDAFNIRAEFSVEIASGEKTRVIKDMSDRIGD